MTRIVKLLALASVVTAFPAFAQSVDVRTGPNGQISGRAEAGGISSSVTAGNGQARSGYNRGRGAVSYAGPCTPGSRSVRVVSPDGSSSSSSSVSVSGSGAVSVAGGGSPGSRVYEGGCPDEGATTPTRVYRTRTVVQPAPSSAQRRGSHGAARRVVHHRRHVRRRAHRRS